MNKKFIFAGSIIFIIFLLVSSISTFFLDYQWFNSYNQLDTFMTLFFTKVNVHFIFGLIFSALFMLNFLLIRISGGKSRVFSANIINNFNFSFPVSPKKVLILGIILIVFFISYFMGSVASSYWKEILMYFNQPAGTEFTREPIFNLAPEFYIFSLPYLKFIYSWLIGSFILILLFSVIFHFLNNGIFVQNNQINFSLFARSHLSTIISIIVIIYGIGYRLSAFDLLFSQRGKFYGAGYTAAHSQLLAYNICMIISFAAALILIFNIFKKSFKLPLFVLGTIIPVYILLGSIIPYFQQRFFVEPNELTIESPYIKNNINFTKMAYGLENIVEKKFANNRDLTASDIQKNRNTIHNVRLWGWQPLLQTYKQRQELKPYYNFSDVDVDRYIIDGNKVAVNISPRELEISKMNKLSKTWINKTLVYTHGYGVVMSRVDKVTPEGLPEMIIKNIPPKSNSNIKVTRPEIYFGEHKNSYVLTNTNIKPGEFDYPSGDKNKYTTYAGTGGVKLDSLFKKLFFALSFNDINILISNNIKKESKILYNRNISKMVKKLTPFIMQDKDPYVVVNKDGKLYWIIDGYTHTKDFPYSTPIYYNFNRSNRYARERRLNYIRNSVKIVIDAYNGTMNYYIIDKKDPIIKTYGKIFPEVFKPIEEMPESLRSHIRYPEHLLNIQSQVLLRYHMEDVNVFYNNEDAWQIPRQIYEDNEVTMESYYLVTTLPGDSESEFILMMPFTPDKKDNMLAFIAAKCDGDNYGQLHLYTLPKEKLSYGPMQLEARINQDAEISKQLTLWSQKGSRVIRGNMMIIPVEESLIFIEPLYLKAETSEMPELKKVIVAFGDKIVMEDNLEDGFNRLFSDIKFSTQDIALKPLQGDKLKDINPQMKEFARRAYLHYLKAEEALKKGNWADYGKEINSMKSILEKMNK